MPSFTSGEYIPPGVYVEEETTPLVTVQTIAPTVVAIVGPSVGYRTFTEGVTLSGTTALSLTKQGIITGSGLQVAAADGTLYATGTDFDLVQTGTAPTNTTTIARDGAGGIDDGETVYVTYRYTDEDYTAPLRVSDYDDVKEAYGEPLDLITGAIISPLSLAAKAAFENGANTLVLVATTDAAATATTRTTLAAALGKLEAIYDVNVVVPLAVGLTADAEAEGVGNDLKNHVESLANDNVFRVGVIGFDTGITAAPEGLAAAFASSRVVLAWPNKMSYYNGYTNSLVTVGGQYLAAAMAGRLAIQAVQEPLTKKQIRGFAGFPASTAANMTNANKNTWSAGGVAVVEIVRDGRLLIRHGTTTQRDTINTRELSLVRAKDAMVSLIYDTAESSGLIGSAINDETPIRVKGMVSSVLETATRFGIIIGYNSLKVRRTSVDPSVIEVKFQYRPAYPLNYILIAFSINTVTGEVTGLDLAA